MRVRAAVGCVLGLLSLVLGGCRRGEVGAQLVTASLSQPGAFVWSGALTPSSVRVVAGLPPAEGRPRLLVATDAELDSVVWRSAPLAVPPEGRVARLDVGGLTPGTRYHYAFRRGDGPPFLRGRFRTPPRGPASFTVAFSGCAATGSSRPVFDAIRRAEPLFFLHLGDAHYEDIAVASPDAYRAAYGRVLRAPAQARLYRSTPVVYVWDDHDYGPNDSDRTAPGQETARLLYRQLVPHYPLAAGGAAAANAPIHHAFTVGRVRFIVTDLRSARDPAGLGETAERTMLGVRQKAWFLDELRRAKGRYGLVVWVSTVPWIGPARERSDRWSGYAAERQQIADAVRDLGLRNLVIVSGDAHMVAIDDGSNSDYATGGGAPIPVIHAAALDRPGSVKGGPYSEGAYPNDLAPPWNGQWVRMEVADDGGPEVCATWTGHRTAWASGATTDLVRWGRCFTVAADTVEVELGG